MQELAGLSRAKGKDGAAARLGLALAGAVHHCGRQRFYPFRSMNR